jgi:phosphatidylinositol-3-phosphatase
MKRFLFGLGIALAACLVIYLTTTDYRPPAKPGTAAPSPVSTAAVPDFNHIFVILEENKGFDDVIGNRGAPYINSLAENGSLLVNYHSTAHPSLPNYLELTSGTNAGITSDCNPPGAGCEANVHNIADEIEQSGRTWKEYAEDMPNPCGTRNDGEYVTKHNPFVYYKDILNNPARCKASVVPLSQLGLDLASGKVPNFSFITPNLCNDMHDCSVDTGDGWLSSVMPQILRSTACTSQSCLVVVTWDENDSGSTNVAAIMIGAGVKNGYRSEVYYTHYSVLHTIESAWGLGALTKNDKTAAIINDVF